MHKKIDNNVKKIGEKSQKPSQEDLRKQHYNFNIKSKLQNSIPSPKHQIYVN